MNLYFKITPLDTLFFRDAKPFSMGSESWADGIFPPFPSTILGAIRTWYITHHPDGPSEQVIQSAKDEVKLLNLAYSVNGEIYFPMPLDFAFRKEEVDDSEKKEKTATKLALKELDVVEATNYPCPMLLLAGEEDRLETKGDGLMGYAQLSNYLQSNIDGEAEVLRIEDFFNKEPKTGIGRKNETLTAEDSKLYRVGMVRPKNFSFVVEVTLPDEFGKGVSEESYLIKLGGEGKVARLERITGELIIDIEKVMSGTSFTDDEKTPPCNFKLYLATPAAFQNGWHPDLSLYGIEAQLVGAAVGKPLYVGGYDMKAGGPKPMVRAVPAGSVYFYKSETTSYEEVVQRLSKKPLSEPLSFKESNGKTTEVNLADDGFGIAYVGKWKNI